MKYIILCSGTYNKWDKPRQLLKINGERIVDRTIRLLRENGVIDIAVTTNCDQFDYLMVQGIQILPYDPGFVGYEDIGYWVDAFYPMREPVCYIFGDVFFSPNAIKTIVEKETDDIEFFASKPPFHHTYTKPYAEPFAFKVQDNYHLAVAVAEVKELYNEGRFKRHPIAWELWQVIKKTPINDIVYTNYTAINDYTCDVDDPQDAADIERFMNRYEL